MLEGRAGYTVVAECGDGVEAVRVLASLRPELVFLDVQMPELDGFGVVEALGEDRLPVIVFVTAFDDYAIRAFEVSAVDYLLKPFDRARFDKALAKASARLHASPSSAADDDELRAFIARLRVERGYPARFVVRSDGRIAFVRVGDVDWIDSAGNYVRLHVGGRVHLLRETMKSVESKLNPETFVRVHRSAIVNIDRVVALEPYFHGEYVVTMRDGAKLTSSRSHSAALRSLVRG
jgi:two-component system LytT family response regulator